MAVDIDWRLGLNTGNPLQSYATGLEQGEKLRAQRETRNALAMYGTDPERAITMLTATDPTKANALMGLYEKRQANEAITGAQNYLAKGDYLGAATATAARNPTFSKSMLDIHEQSEKQLQDKLQRGASVLAGALALPPEQRAGYAAQHRDEAINQFGIKPEDFDAIDWTNDGAIRARATSALELKDALTYFQNEAKAAAERGDKEREAQLEQQKFDWLRQYQTDQLAIQGRNAASSAVSANASMINATTNRTRSNRENVSPSAVVGRIMEKRASGQALTPDEDAALDIYSSTMRSDPYAMFNSLGIPPVEPDGAGYDVAPAPIAPLPPARPPAPRATMPPPVNRAPPPRRSASQPGARGPAGSPASNRPARAGAPGSSKANPVRPANRAAAERLPSGTWFVDPAGNVGQRE